MDVVKQGKVDHVGTDYSKDRRRSHSRDRNRIAMDTSVSYEKGGDGLDDVSIGMQWSGDGVSMSQGHENIPTSPPDPRGDDKAVH